ncbi:TerB family tellurite resistance protein [Beijerinckia sp. L45]|uniref:TerB family tellurite resistance protein n=1 Tax=Beijerinckia sp. L45 TaxID=1641855 RepID=UPI00131DF511|nr:TerB family tellurite resistance protein [Beijerinckia sp. L45]
MPILLGLVAFVGIILVALYRINSAIDSVRELDGKTQGLQRVARNAGLSIFGWRLQRVTDPRLAATILMLQLVRTGAPVTAAEKTRIMEIMETELHIGKVEAMFVRAWSYTEQNRVFSPIADELIPLLRDRLTTVERDDLIGMLTKVANAYTSPSELQLEAINRLKRRLLLPEPNFTVQAERPFGDEAG